MNRIRHDIELGENLEPLVNANTEFLRIALPYVVAMAFYVTSLDVGLWLCETLRKSPLINVLGGAFAFFVLTVAWIAAFLIFGIIGGDFDFANKVFLLIKEPDLRISMAVVFLGFFIAKVVAGVIRKTSLPYSAKLNLFWISCILVFLGLLVFCSLANRLSGNHGSYYFAYTFLWIVYIVAACL